MLYIEVYYAFSYYGLKQFRDEQLRDFSPAVAVQDRMIMVPQGVGKLLESDGGVLLPFKPLEMGGVAEVNFQDEMALSATAVEVAQTLRAAFLSTAGRKSH